MGRKDPERQQAIAAALAETEPSDTEDFLTFMANCDNEDSRAIEDSNEFQARCDSVRNQIKQLGITPTAWFNALQWPTSEDCLVRDYLADRWETENEPDNPADWPDEHDRFAHYQPLSDQEMEEERLADLWADRFDGPGDYADEWSGPTIPTSAILQPFKDDEEVHENL